MSEPRTDARSSATACGEEEGPAAATRSSLASGLQAALREGYRSGTACLLHPSQRDRETLLRGPERLAGTLPEAAARLEAFLEHADAWSEDLYLETLELAPACPPYLGAQLFDEPESCRGAARSDRNPYMVELRGVYRHFGLELDGSELPDYLPLMADFLRLTVGAKAPRDVSIRRYFLEELLLPGIRPLGRDLEERGSPYALSVRALESVAERDAARHRDVPRWSPPEEERRSAPTCRDRLAGIAGGSGTEGGIGASRASGSSEEERRGTA